MGFGRLLEAYGYESQALGDESGNVAPELRLRGRPDHHYLGELERLGHDFYLSFDWNRQAEVWSQVYGRLTNNTGRMLRIKPRNTEPNNIATIGWYWAKNFARMQEHIERPGRVRLLQVGHQILRQRPEPRGFRAYTSAELARATQQIFSDVAGDLRVPGSVRQRDVRRGGP